MTRLLVLLGLVLAVLGVSGAAPAHASCAADSGPAGSDVIFVGTPQEERRGFTRLAVDEVWAGPDLRRDVWVRSGQEQPPFPFFLFSSVASSTDAALLIGESYVVGASSDFRTSACTVVEEGADVGSLRPAEPRSPVADGSTGANPPRSTLELVSFTVGGVLLVSGAAIAWRHRRRTKVS